MRVRLSDFQLINAGNVAQRNCHSAAKLRAAGLMLVLAAFIASCATDEAAQGGLSGEQPESKPEVTEVGTSVLDLESLKSAEWVDLEYIRVPASIGLLQLDRCKLEQKQSEGWPVSSDEQAWTRRVEYYDPSGAPTEVSGFGPPASTCYDRDVLSITSYVDHSLLSMNLDATPPRFGEPGYAAYPNGVHCSSTGCSHIVATTFWGASAGRDLADGRHIGQEDLAALLGYLVQSN